MDPRTWTPKKDIVGWIEYWGVQSEHDENDSTFYVMQAVMARMMLQNTYQMKNRDREEAGQSPIEFPSRQFIRQLIEWKRAQLAAKDFSAMQKRDIVIEVSLGFDPTVYRWTPELLNANFKPIARRIRLSAGTKLSVFQDKILQPAFGWNRNFHAYVFTDFRDGAQFGTERSENGGWGRSIDLMHSDKVAHLWLEDHSYTLTHLFEKAGDTFGYLYDFGDRFKHDIENMKGNCGYGERLAKFQTASARERLQFKTDVLSSPNYSWWKGPDVMAAQRRLGVALASKQSVPAGAEVHKIDFTGGMSLSSALAAPPLKKGQFEEKVFTDGSQNNYWSEAKNTGVDERGQRICAVCGISREEKLQK